METFAVRNLTFYYPGQETAAINDISFSITAGQFVTLCGPSGSGKSTLLRLLKPALTPHGRLTGCISFEDTPLEEIDERTQAMRIGFVQQSVENQIVTDKVWHELAFGPESLGWDSACIRLRVAEISSFLGIDTWFHKKVTELSGGQKQLLNLASVMVMHPDVLILDEPTSLLDPIAASEFLATLKKVNLELGTTVIITEHRLEEVFSMSDRILAIDGGRLIADGTPKEVGIRLKQSEHPLFLSMPAAMRIWAGVDDDSPCPVTVRDGRSWLDDFASRHTLLPLPPVEKTERSADTVISLHEVGFKYEKNLPDVLGGVNLQIRKGEFFALLGGNGSGKSTLLSVVCGLLKPYRGNLQTKGTAALLPQDPKTLFTKKTVREDLLDVFYLSKDEPGRISRFEETAALCRLQNLLTRHPYDLSAGEQQRVALAKILLLDPDILLLDEPTKGLDADFKQVFGEIAKALALQGITIFMVSHDVEFCAEFCDRCALLFDGGIVTENTPSEFFSGNSFYTTSSNRIARNHIEKAVTTADVIKACGGNPDGDPDPPSKDRIGMPDAAVFEANPQPEAEITTGSEENPKTPYYSCGNSDAASPQMQRKNPASKPAAAAMYTYSPHRLPFGRKIVAAVSALLMIISFARILSVSDFSEMLAQGSLQVEGGNYFWFGVLFLGLVVFAASTWQKASDKLPQKSGLLSKRIYTAVALIVLLIPLTLLAGVFLVDDRKYLIISLLVLAETMIPFFLIFESRNPRSREIVVVAVLCAIAVAGRAAFFMFPGIKPVMAVVIISGVAFGAETGFLVGSVSMLASNMFFAQGPWTPWQMFAMGIVGFIAGILFRKGLLCRDRLSLCIFGALAAIIIYGGIMNPASALMWVPKPNLETILAYYVTGIPFDVVHALATALFLWFAAEPFLEKLDRIKTKYGLAES